MRVTYVLRSFLDYRVPVFAALRDRLNGGFSVVYCADVTPERVQRKAEADLDGAAIGLPGEKRVGPKIVSGFANSSFRVVYQPGLLDAIERTRPDVLLADGFFQWTLYALMHRIRHGIPLVICYERTGFTERNAQWMRTAYRRQVLRRWVGAMTCNGALSREYALFLGMPADRVTTGQMAADTENLAKLARAVSPAERAAIRAQWGEADVVLAAVGRLVEPKGLRELLLGWSILEKRSPGAWRLVLVGDGPEEQKLRALARELELRNVIFAGAVDYSKIHAIYAASDALVMPTLEDNWSLVVPEAMACGLPVLCSVYNGCHPELVRPGENGWVFDPLNREDTAATFQRLVNNQTSLPAMGEASRRIVADHTPAHAADAILRACDIALSHRNRKGHAHPVRP